jgi:tRNA-Thr(GGU) m(6)t(6)A37 methyltransferase TsaA
VATARYVFEPIGTVRCGLTERAAAPRQPGQPGSAPGRIELVAGRGYEHALEGLELWTRLWLLFVFHKNVEQARDWKAKVLPPRSDRKHGVFATRSPHRPNPLGLSCVTLERVEGLSVHVRGLDVLDGSPVLDIKPYVPYADAHPGDGGGWLAADPLPAWQVDFSRTARQRIEWLKQTGVDLEPSIEHVLRLGPQPNPYRRIRKGPDGLVLAIKGWRIDFEVAEERSIVVTGIRSGFRPRDQGRDGFETHRAFASKWG